MIQLLSSNFNSIKVQLKRSAWARASASFAYFNSIKVQLKLTLDKGIYNKSIFQFHKGTIKTLFSPFF